MVIQGFGNVGSYLANFLHEQGAKIVGIADVYGAIYDENGLDIPHLMERRDSFGAVTNLFSNTITNRELLEKECDVLIPAALGGKIKRDQNRPEVHGQKSGHFIRTRLSRPHTAGPDEVAAIIMEPVQGEGGFVIPSKTFVQGVKQICEKHGILFIADEIQTGFGRTGKMFAMDHLNVVPDLMILSKSIAAGLPISAVTGRAEIMDAPEPGQIGGTYGGSPLGCVAASKVIEMMVEDDLVGRANVIGQRIVTRFKQLQEKHEAIGEVRGLGAMVAVELVKDRASKTPDDALTSRIVQECIRRGVIILSAGLFKNVIRFLTPLVITDEQLEEALDIIEEVFDEVR